MNQNLRYKKINNFLQGLNLREQKYIVRKLNEEIQEQEIGIVSCNIFINGKQIQTK